MRYLGKVVSSGIFPIRTPILKSVKTAYTQAVTGQEEYSKNYTWVNGSSIKSVLDGMRSGKSFSVFGDLIDALEFQAKNGNNTVDMGGDLKVKEGQMVKITVRFKSPEKNNNGDPVKVDHVDLISGEVTGKAEPGTPCL